ncbi:MAG: DUF1501 domain-containing protein [Dehalococcoidia bacterium]|nr:DUF1501 domain-containing protein [Dehalococcoidia bacterium]
MPPDFEALNGSIAEPFEDRTRLAAPLSRRHFLTKGLAVVGLGTVIPAAFVRAVFAEGVPSGVVSRRRVLVVLQLGGGNDGLNTVIPYADGAYFGARPRIGVNPEAVLHLDGKIGLHPSLQGVKNLWDRGQVAIVQGVGYPQPNRSHFRSMEIWHTGSTAEHERTGWLGRLLDSTKHEQHRAWHAANVGSSMPMSLLSNGSFVPSLNSVPTYTLNTDTAARGQSTRRVTDLVRLYAEQAALGGALALLSKTGAQAYESTVDLRREASTYQPLATYPTNALGTALRTLAQVVTSNLGTTIGYVTTGGFDSHANQKGSQPALLQAVSEAVSAFYADLTARGMDGDVLTVMWTEFGRRVRENASGGTDHGTANPVFLFGGGVHRGLYGEQPSLGHLDENGDLRFTTDFRSIYATLLARWFATDPKDVLPGSFPELPFL